MTHAFAHAGMQPRKKHDAGGPAGNVACDISTHATVWRFQSCHIPFSLKEISARPRCPPRLSCLYRMVSFAKQNMPVSTGISSCGATVTSGRARKPCRLIVRLKTCASSGSAYDAAWSQTNQMVHERTGVCRSGAFLPGSACPRIGDWSDAELLAYLHSGDAPGRASAAGPMGETVEHSLQCLSAEDLKAIV
ncbi:MAG: hypothetical protein ACRYGL_18295, partial [Janthinobacterium lividum]